VWQTSHGRVEFDVLRPSPSSPKLSPAPEVLLKETALPRIEALILLMLPLFR
jgi:hypothetical protein